jgi:glycosidase
MEIRDRKRRQALGFGAPMGSRRALVVATAAIAALGFAPVAAGKIVLRHDTFGGVYRSPGGAVAAGTPVRLRLSVSGALATRVLLRVEVADPVAGTSRLSNLRMRRLGALWTVTYRTPAKPAIVAYSFRVTIGHRTLWYGDDNSSTDVTKGGTGRMTSTRDDAFRITVYARDFTTPAWLQGAVVYSIFPDRFRNGDPTNDYCRAGSTSGCPTFYGDVPALLHPNWNEPLEDSRATGVFNRDFFGGDLQGVTEKLDYLKSLGVEAIWLTPIFKARSNHRYDTDDYLKIDPGLGTEDAFSALSAAAKARGIRIILDGVFNHTSSDSLYFDRYNRYPDVLGACESPSSPFRGWFEITGSEVPCTSYSGFANLDSLPTLNDESASVRDFIFRGSASVVAYWTRIRGADGWRLDVAHELSHSWWRDFRTSVKRYAPDAPLIGEITAGPVDATEYLFGDELDGVMNYRFRQIAIGFVRQTSWTDSSGTIPALRPSQAAHALRAILDDYPKQAAAVAFNLIDSHDTNRALYALTEPGAGGTTIAQQRLRLAALLQFTSLGAPMVYYGDEAGINAPGKSGFGDPYNRAPFPWTDESGNVLTYGPPDIRTTQYYEHLGALRHQYPGLRTGSVVTLFASADIFAFARVAPPDKPIIVVLNKAEHEVKDAIPIRGLYPNGLLQEPMTGDKFTISSGDLRVDVQPRSGLLLVGQ